jgi:ribose transport system substrate-binding protein
MKKLAFVLFTLAILWSTPLFAQTKASQKKELTIAFVTNGAYTFWTYAKAGTKLAESEMPVKVVFYAPPNGTAEEQKRFIETMAAKGVDGIGVSVLDPANATSFLNSIGSRIPMVMFDSDADAATTNRKAYVGISNYGAGRTAGKEIAKALPSGGKFIIFVGKLDVQNAIERRQGIIDELLGLPAAEFYPGNMTPNTDNIQLGKWTLITTKLDGGDPVRAKSGAEEMIVAHPDAQLMAGLWSYSTPAFMSALKDAKLLGKVKIVAFDEDDMVLQGIKDGFVEATIVQNPFEYGHTTVKLLYELARGTAKIPANKLISVPGLVITKGTVAAFEKKLADQIKASY